MKKLVFAIIAVIATMGLNAQEAAKTSGTDKKMWLGGRVGFGTDNVKDGQTSSGWAFGPTFGYFLNDKMAVGIGLDISGSTTKENDVDDEINKSMGWTVEPFFRYYFAGTGNFRFYGEAYLGFGGGKNTYEDNAPTSSESKYGSFGVGVRPGLQYWFNNNWSMNSTIGALSYASSTYNKGEASEYSTNQFNLKADFTSINFALNFHF